jgi:hypothetical protein
MVTSSHTDVPLVSINRDPPLTARSFRFRGGRAG